ncbi:hypothetical protein Sjap_001216 [Stephania japonica]|uniref:Uncharacterized protein n=1 Tax=Stephania japonica TaxID=461633 RepID=A0AAP0KJK8_9MAGN
MYLGGEDVEGEEADGGGGELEGGELALEGPGGAVHVEDAAPEEVTEDGGEGLAFGVVGELGVEDVVDVDGVGCDDVVEGVEGDGAGGGLAEEVGVEVGEVGEVQGPCRGQVGVAGVA